MSAEAINRKTVVATGILAFIVLTALCLRHNIPAIGDDLTDRASEALRDKRMGWAELQFDGRDLTISGVAPDDAARARAVLVASVDGVRVVDNQLTTVVEYVNTPAQTRAADPATRPAARESAGQAAPAPVIAARYRSRFTVADNGIVLAGSVPDEATRRRVVQQAQALFGVAAVEVRLELNKGAPPGWTDAAMTGLDIAGRLVMGEVIFDDTSIQVTGLTGTNEGDGYIRTTLAERLPENFSGSAETASRAGLESVLRTSPELARRLARSGKQPEMAQNTPSALNAGGCATEFYTVLDDRRVLFGTASTTLTGASELLLDELAAILKRCPTQRLSIEGHTDDQGLIENNLTLSQRRAESVMQYLVANGVSLSRLSARGFGESVPLVPNDSASDRAINRRIEFVFEGL